MVGALEHRLEEIEEMRTNTTWTAEEVQVALACVCGRGGIPHRLILVN